MIRGINGRIFQSFDRDGWDIYLRKYENGKIYKPLINIDWVECSEYERIEPLRLDQLANHDSMDKESKLYGENESRKNEIEFLRGQVDQMLKRLTVKNVLD